MSEWMKNVRKTEPYVPGEQPGTDDVIKLNTNENPYPPAPGVRKACMGIDTDRFRLYPDPDVTALTNAIADYYNVADSEVFIGVGSDDVLAMSFLTFFNSDKPVLFADITYSFYDVWAKFFGIPYKKCALKDDFRIDINDYMTENGGIVIANPNAPTSLYEPVDNLEKIIAANSASVVIIDEAYIDFGGESVLPLIHKYDNLLVVRTFSKSRSMAGIRIGYAMGNRMLISALKDAKASFNSYTMNMPSIIMGTEAVKDDEYFKSTVNKIIKTRIRTVNELEKLGFSVLDSKANFVFASHETIPAKEIFEKLRAQNIYVRYFDKPRIDNYLRITVGTDAEMDIFLGAVKKIKKSVDISRPI